MINLLQPILGFFRFFFYTLGLFFLGLGIVLSALLLKVLRLPPFYKPLFYFKQSIPQWWGLYMGWLSQSIPVKWHIDGMDNLPQDVSYMVICNHQSWLDTLALQYAFSYRVPPSIFFFKRSLYKVPLLGVILWASDFIPVHRYSRAYLAKYPEHRGRDLERTRKMCRRHIKAPVSVVNFVEGTRFTLDKKAQQNSPYTYLLKPRAGGMAFALSTLDKHIKTILDITVVYPQGEGTFWNYFSGKVKEIHVYARALSIESVPKGNYEEDEHFRNVFQQWLNHVWEEKDALLLSVYSRYAQIK